MQGQDPWKEARARFPSLAETAYLDSAAYGALSTEVRDSVLRALEQWSAAAPFPTWEEAGERSRALFARITGTVPENVALLPAVSVAAGQVARELPFRPGANLVVGEGEFHSNLYPWMAQERRGFELRLVPQREGRMALEDYLERIDARTALVALSSVQSSNGYRVPLPPIVARCRRHGARIFVDATQSAGALALDLDGLDYVAVAGYKWLCSPRGTTFLYVAPSRRDEMQPLSPGWKTPDRPYESYYGPPFDLAPRASRFDVSLAWLAWAGGEPALRLVAEIGTARIEPRVLALARSFAEGLERLGLSPMFAPEERSQIVSVRMSEAPRLRDALRERGVIASARAEYLRFGFHFYNDEGDVERALAALAE